MDTVNDKKTGRYFILTFVLSAILISAAVINWYIEQQIDSISILSAIVGIILLLFCVIYKGSYAFKTIGQIPWNRAAKLISIPLLSITFLVAVNYLANRLDYRWDLTQYQQHTLTQSTIDFLEGLPVTDQPIQIIAFYVGLPPKYLEDLLNEYQRIANGKLSIKITDPIEDIAYAAKYGNVIDGSERKLIVILGNERKDVDFSDASLSEEQVTNALSRVSRKPRQVYFLTGHGELSMSNEDNQGLSFFAEQLQASNISSKSLMLGTAKKIPDDCDVLIIAAPKTHLTSDEEVLINDYLEQGGDALFLVQDTTIIDSKNALILKTQVQAPSLNSMLHQWGLNVGEDIVVDLASHIGGDVGSPASKNYIDHKAITAGLDYSFYVRPRSITTIANRRETIKLAPVVLTASKEKSWAETNQALRVNYDEGIDIPGPIAISYVVWEEGADADESDTRIIVFTDADFLSNAYFKQYSHAALGHNVINWLSELDYTPFLDQKNIEVERLDLTSKQTRMITALLFLMPLLIAVLGLCVWIRLRQRAQA